MNHLTETGYSYFEHLRRAWKISFVCLVHGLLPNIWKHKASELLCEKQNEDS